MIGKAGAGSGFRGLGKYLEEGRKGEAHERVAWVEGRNLPTADIGTATKIMRATANENGRIEKPVYHLSLAWDAGDSPSRQQMSAAAERVLQDLGLEKHQTLVVAHNDGKTPHLHLLVNRVGPDGKAWDRSHDYARIERSLRALERENGWREVPGRHHQLERQQRPERAQLSQGERRKAERTQAPPFAVLVKIEAGRTLREAETWQELHRGLAEHGLRVAKEGRGLVVTDGSEKAKASSIDRAASLAALERRLGRYEQPGRDIAGARGPDRGPDGRERGRAEARPDHERSDRPAVADRGADERPAEGGRPDRAPRGPGDGPEFGAADRGAGDRPGGRPDRGRDRGGDGGGPGPAHPPVDGPNLDTLRAQLSRLEALDRAREAATAEVGRWHQESARLERRAAYADKLDREKNMVFQGVYRDPQKAQARFEQLAAAKGIGRATRALEERPESFGRVRGWGIGPIRSQERLEALEAAREAGGAARKAAAMSKAVAKENGQRGDARAKLDAAHHRQRQEAERMPERRQLVREIATASRGLTDEQWKGLGRDQQRAVTQARQSVQAEQGRSRGRGRGIGY